MNRRGFLKTSLLFAAFGGLSGFPFRAVSANAFSENAILEIEKFSLAALKRLAEDLSKTPWRDNAITLPPSLANLDPRAYNAITYNPARSLWHDIPDRQLDVQFFPTGMHFTRPVRIFALDPISHRAQEIAFEPGFFSGNKAGIDVDKWKNGPMGFSGFRVYKAPDLLKKDIIAFLGASYFRAVDNTYQYGLSARAVALDTFAGREEFPDFTAFWFEPPAPGTSTFKLFALLEGPSLTGAYQFIIHCDKERILMEVESTLFIRKDIKQLGIAPLTSMYSCGTHERRMCKTYHPQLHDSDRLTLWRGNSEWLVRPLNNPRRIQFNAFEDDNPRGFGLVQTEHNFTAYQDVFNRYDQRPSLWVEPVGKWGKGSVQLMEMPTSGETLDNIVCFWQPEKPIKAGSTHQFKYNLHWSALPPVQSPLAQIGATRSGMGGFPEGWAPGERFPSVWCRRFTVDFIAGDLKAAALRGIEPVITVASGQVKQVEILYIQPLDAYRILFDWYPETASSEPIEFRLFLRSQGIVLSETWLYQYFPPPLDERRYPEWR